MHEIKLEDYVRMASDVYFPEVDFFYPEIRKVDAKNIPNNFGFYPDSILQKGHGWKRLAASKPDDTGFFAALYVEEKNAYGKNPGPGVIVFRGSDDVYDFIHHDLKIAKNEWPRVYQKAEDFYKDIRDQYKDLSFSFAGHSLGGGLAQLVSIYANQKDYMHKDKCLAICFNAPQMGFLIKYNKKDTLKFESPIDWAVKNFREKIQNQIWSKKACDVVDKASFYLEFVTKNKVLQLMERAAPYACSLARGIFHLAPDFKNLGDELKPSVAEVYSDLAGLKNLKECVNYGQPAFNAMYHLVTDKPDQFAFNKKDFLRHYDEMTSNQNYNFIYNFNAFYDIVHTCGVPIGNQLEIDIDAKKYAEYRNMTLTDQKIRAQAELRTFLTVQPEYLSFQPQKFSFKHHFTHIEPVSNAYFRVKSVDRNCNFDLQRDVLKHLNLNYDGYVELTGKLVDNVLKPRWAEEAVYYTDTQHVMKHFGNVLLNDKNLANISFGKNTYRNVRAQFADYKANNPYIKFDKTFHSKIKDMMISSGLVNEGLCVGA